jgi:hypothetical protein
MSTEKTTIEKVLVVDDNTLDRVKGIMKVVTADKLMKSFNRTVNDNIKLDRFLSNEIKLPKAFDPEKLVKTIDGLVLPTKHEHHGLINVERQQDILSLFEAGLIAQEIAAKQAWLGTFSLNEEQQRKAAEVMSSYEKTLKVAVNRAVKSWRQVYGTKEK